MVKGFASNGEVEIRMVNYTGPCISRFSRQNFELEISLNPKTSN